MSGLSTKHMVLGLVVEKHQTYGYALQVQIDRRFEFLQLSGGAVYGVLKRLCNDGWIEAVESERGVFDIRRQPYRATPDGAVAFREWMAAPSERPLVRDELQAKLGLAGPDDLPDLLEQAEAQLAACVGELTSKASPNAADARSPNTPWGAAARILAEDYHSQMLSGTIDWLTSAIEVLKAHIARHGTR